MPLTYEQAKSRDFYRNIQDADEQKHLKAVEEEKNRAAISGSAIDALNPLRDENGFLLSYEDPNEPGKTLTEDYQYVRLNVEQKSSATGDTIRHFGDDLQFLEIMPRATEEPIMTEAELNLMKTDLRSKIEEQDILNQTLDVTMKQLQNSIAVTNDLPEPYSNVDEELANIQASREEISERAKNASGLLDSEKQGKKTADAVTNLLAKTTGD